MSVTKKTEHIVKRHYPEPHFHNQFRARRAPGLELVVFFEYRSSPRGTDLLHAAILQHSRALGSSPTFLIDLIANFRLQPLERNTDNWADPSARATHSAHSQLGSIQHEGSMRHGSTAAKCAAGLRHQPAANSSDQRPANTALHRAAQFVAPCNERQADGCETNGSAGVRLLGELIPCLIRGRGRQQSLIMRRSRFKTQKDLVVVPSTWRKPGIAVKSRTPPPGPMRGTVRPSLQSLESTEIYGTWASLFARSRTRSLLCTAL